MATDKRYYITTPIYYVNDAPHIGHAYTTVVCDALARFKRLDGFEVMFVTGTDEHGQKVEKSASNAGVAPEDFCDRVSQNFRDMNVLLNISNDQFIRTTEQRHIQACQALWNQLYEKGQMYLGKFAGWYSVRDEAFYEESEISGGCAPTGAPVEWVEEANYFFRLSDWQTPLLELYERNPRFIWPASRRNEVVSFVKAGLRDLSVSRTSLRWGIPVPNADDHVMYVWLDALTNYLTAVGYPDLDAPEYRKFWPATLHVVGKDIVRFHCVYWPAFLMAAGLPVPERILAHGWWTVDGKKMSKSLGNFISPSALVETCGVDPLRYFLLRDLPLGNDGNLSREAIIARLNGDLANDLGNLAQRVLTMIHRECAASLPQPDRLEPNDTQLLERGDGLLDKLRSDIEQQLIHRALESLWEYIGEINQYVDAQAPWAVKRIDRTRMDTILYTAAESIRRVALLVQPFMPTAGSALLDQLGVAPEDRKFAAMTKAAKPGTPLPAPTAIFPRKIE